MSAALFLRGGKGEGGAKMHYFITFLNNKSSITLWTWVFRSLIVHLIDTNRSKIFEIIISGCGLPHPLFPHGVIEEAKVIMIQGNVIWYCWNIIAFLNLNNIRFIQNFESRWMSVELICYVKTIFIFFNFHHFFCSQHSSDEPTVL